MASEIQVILNNTIIDPSEFSGTRDSKVNIRQKDKDGLVFSYLNDIEFTGSARQILFDEVINAPNPFTSFVPIVLKDTCCKEEDGSNLIIFEGRIKVGDIKYCEGQCFINVSAEDNSVHAQQLQCIKNTPIWATESLDGTITSNGEDEAKSAVFYEYCVETRPKTMMWLRMLFASLSLMGIIPVLFALAPLIVLFSGFQITPAELDRFALAMRDNLIGCDKKHKAPFIYAYLQNVCKLCNLQLESTLFDVGGPYHNLTHLNIPFDDGGATTQKANEIFKDVNFLNFTLTQFLQDFQSLNIDYAVEEGKLVVERKDFFTNNIWIDFAANPQKIIKDGLCYNFGEEGPKAGRVYQFQKDASDIGEEANRFWGGSVVDYNDPYNPLLRGVDQNIIPFAPARFMDDNFDSIIRKFKTWPILGTYIVKKHVLLLSVGTSSIPKLLMWDGVSDKEEARVERKPISNNQYIYNTDAWLRNDIAQIVTGGGDFYTRLLFIDDPRLNLIKNIKFELTFEYECEDLRSFEFGSRIKFSRSGVVETGTIDKLEIDYQKRQAKIEGVF